MKLRIPLGLDIRELAIEPKYLVYGRRKRNVDGVRKQVWIEDFFKTKKLLRHTDYCYAILDVLIRINEQDQGGDQGVFTNLKQEYLMDVVPKSTIHTVISFLVALGIIECDGICVASHMRKKGEKAKSYGYRLTEHFRGEITVIETTGRVIKKKESSAKARTQKELQKYDNLAYRYQVRQFLEGSYSVQENAVELIPKLLGKIDSKGKVITGNRIARMVQEVEKISLGSLEGISVNGYGRFHSSVTQMTYESRSFINGIDGKGLVQLDFKSSYTFHLINLIKGYVRVYLNNTYQTYQHAGTLLEQEVNLLYQICINDDLYTYIAQEYEKANGPLHTDPEQARQLVKSCWNHSFLNVESADTFLLQFIESLFPEINRFIEGWGRFRLWKALMRSESNLVHKTIVARIAEEIGFECTLFAIHDAILTDRSHDGQILGIMMEEARDYFGFEARIKSEKLQRPSLENQWTRREEDALVVR